MENHTAKHFVLQLGSLVSLYLSLSFLLVLLFGLITILIPDAADSTWAIDNASSMVRIGIAFTIVFYPTYLVLTRIVNKTRRKDPQGAYLGLTKWLIYLSLLIGGTALLIDLVMVIMTWLEGDITSRFLLKALAVLLIVGSAVYYYLLDARGYWLSHESKSIIFGGGASVVVAAILIVGFSNIDTPAEVREQKLDDTQITDLQEIENRITNYLVVEGELPTSLTSLYTEIPPPTAPEGRAAYEYNRTETGYELCATFASASERGDMLLERPMMPTKERSAPYVVNAGNWEHAAGDVCFDRVVEQPEL